jgi:hypothetical protein
MSEPFQDPALEGQRRATAWQAHLEASQAASSAAEVEAHRASSEGLRAAHQGLYGHSTGEQLAATVAAGPARVGDAWGNGRELETRGGFDFEAHGAGAVAPIPPRADLRFVNQQGQRPTGESPLARWHRENR